MLINFLFYRICVADCGSTYLTFECTSVRHTYICRMARNSNPLVVREEDELSFSQAEVWIHSSYPNVQLSVQKTLIQHLYEFISSSEAVVHNGVHTQLCNKSRGNIRMRDKWLVGLNKTLNDYAAETVHPSFPMDVLFVVLASRWAKIHVAMVHNDGVWSTRASGGSQEGDLMLFLTDKGIRVAEPVPIADLSVIGGEWVPPPVIQSAVQDIAEATWCMGFKPC